MNIEALKTQIDNARATMARNEGVISQIQENWKKDFGISSPEEAQALIDSLNKQIAASQEKIAAIRGEIEKVIGEKLAL